MAGLLAYAALLTLVVLTALRRREPTLWTARSLLRLHLAFWLALAVWSLLAASPAPLVAFVASVPVAGLFLASHRRWWILRAAPGDVRRLLEESLERVRVPFTRSNGGYVLEQRNGPPLILRVHAGPASSTTLDIAAGPRTRKTKLGLRLLSKQHAGLLPRLRIRVSG